MPKIEVLKWPGAFQFMQWSLFHNDQIRRHINYNDNTNAALIRKEIYQAYNHLNQIVFIELFSKIVIRTTLYNFLLTHNW